MPMCLCAYECFHNCSLQLTYVTQLSALSTADELSSNQQGSRNPASFKDRHRRMEDRIDAKVERLLGLIKKQPSRLLPSAPRCSDDQIEEAETVAFSWNVEEIMNVTDESADPKTFSQNPAAVQLMASCYFSNSDLYRSFGNFKSKGESPIEVDAIDYHDLLEIQNRAWGEQKVVQGIAAARVEKYESAIELCKAALSFIPNSVEAYVCRGASYANMNRNDKAVRDFEKALYLDPTNQNAFQYLKKIKDMTLKATTPTSVVLPVEAVETRKLDWHLVPSKVKFVGNSRDLIAKSSSSSVAESNDPLKRTTIDTVNGYSFERGESPGDSSNSDSSHSSNAKKRKRVKEPKKKKPKKEERKKRSRKHKDRKKEKKERKVSA